MSSVLRSLRSPAVIISILALVAGVTGAAVAGPIAHTSKLTKKDKKKVRSIADQEISKLAPTLAVKSATTANTATSVSSGGVKQSSFAKTANVTIDFPNTSGTLGANCGTLTPPGLGPGTVPSGGAVLMTPPSGKFIGWTTIAGVITGGPSAGEVYVDFCNLDGVAENPPAAAGWVFDVIAP